MNAMDPPGGPSSRRPSRELDDLITRHLDGDLDAVGQRRLAEMLAASEAARRCLARYLRLEAATIRLASAGQWSASALQAATAAPPAVAAHDLTRADRPDAADRGRLRRWRGTAVALAGGLLAAGVLGLLVTGVWRFGPRRGGELDLLAAGWIDLQQQQQQNPAELVPAEAASDTALPEPDPAAPPGWLVAALALENSEAAPDES
jgi:anti-sigma factor RsiW